MRFRITHLLLATAVVAVTLYLFKEARAVTSARDHFLYTEAMYDVGRVRLDDLTAAASSLRQAETTAFWITRRQATSNHIDRLTDIVARYRDRLLCGGDQETQDRRQAQFAQIPAEIARLTHEAN